LVKKRAKMETGMARSSSMEVSALTRHLFKFDKMKWGLKNHGVLPMVAGLFKFAMLSLRKPERSRLALRSGGVLEFAFPSQTPSALLIFGDFIDPEFAFLRKIAQADWVVADIGAAIGQFTLFAANLPVAHVHAFEPSSANLATLTQNILINGVSHRVTPHQLAFSNVDTEAYFETTASTWVSGLSDSGTERVLVRRLSSTFKHLNIQKVSVLKLNVAGHEPKILESSMEFLARGGADILILLLGIDSIPWYQQIANCGYRFFYYHPKMYSLYEVNSFSEDSVLNYRPWPARHIIAIHNSKVDEMENFGISIRPI
jgi:FkbM family methyltransferase